MWHSPFDGLTWIEALFTLAALIATGGVLEAVYQLVAGY